MNKHTWIQVFKIGIGSALAILIAEWMGLSYATSAGIVTLLTIQNTRKDTFHLALRRIASFGVTVLIAYVCVNFIPMRFVSFGIFMLALVGISYYLDGLTWKLVGNEAAMVLIGIVIAVLFNMRMPSKEAELQMDIAHIDSYMDENLISIANHLCSHSKLDKDKRHLNALLDHISGAIDKAYANRNNTLRSHSDYYIDYLNFRKEQCEILLHVYYIVAHHDFVVDEAKIVAEVIREVAGHLHVQKEIEAVMHKIDKTAHEIIHGEMPKNQQEFEGKAVLYQLLYELREFLWHQEMFIENVTEEQILAYWE